MNKYKFIHNLSIKSKIIIIILSIFFLIHSITFTFITIWDIKRIKSEIQTSLVLNTKIVADNCIVPLTFRDDQQAIRALSNLNKIDFIERAYLLDINDNIFATYPAGLMTKEEFPQFTEQESSILKDDYFYMYEPVVFQNKKHGTLFIKANSEPLKTAKRDILITLFLFSILLDIFAIFLAIRMQRYISRPIINLKNHFDRIAKNQDFSQRIEKQSNDEVGHLYDGFNNLSSHIQIRRKEKNLVEIKLRDSQEKLKLALQGGEIGIWEWDLKTDLTIWDKRMEKMFGLEAGTFNQSYNAFKECLHPDDVLLAENAIQDALNNISPYDIIYRVVWKNNDIKFIRAKALISKDNNQTPIKMIGVCFDVTEIKETEKELQIHREKLEDTVKERTKKLEEKNTELESFNQIFIDREYRIKELKDELETLKSDKKN